jgi:hypothetical protein
MVPALEPEAELFDCDGRNRREPKERKERRSKENERGFGAVRARHGRLRLAKESNAPLGVSIHSSTLIFRYYRYRVRIPARKVNDPPRILAGTDQETKSVKKGFFEHFPKKWKSAPEDMSVLRLFGRRQFDAMLSMRRKRQFFLCGGK